MDRLPTANSAAKLIFLSKRWNHLWLSHPIVKFDEIEFPRWFNDDSFYESAVKEFANAVLRKLSQREAYTTAVRITVSWRQWNSKLCSRFLDDILDRLAAKKVPSSLQEINFRFDRALHFKENPVNYIAYNIPLGLLKFDRLRILKLAYCDFRLYTSDSDNSNPFPGFGSCLELLDLDRVSFPNGRILNNMIASAALLKTLILNSVFGIGRFQVRNHPNLKVLRANRLIGDIVEIIGAQSLEILKLTDWGKGELQISSIPNLKVMHIESKEFSDFI
ncbi:hypothetical protein LINPERPRIM_LOCUS33730 [Linum perenne]